MHFNHLIMQGITPPILGDRAFGNINEHSPTNLTKQIIYVSAVIASKYRSILGWDQYSGNISDFTSGCFVASSESNNTASIIIYLTTDNCSKDIAIPASV